LKLYFWGDNTDRNQMGGGDKRAFYLDLLCAQRFLENRILRMSVNNFKAIFTLLVFLIAGMYPILHWRSSLRA
jgi:hypothetical protein